MQKLLVASMVASAAAAAPEQIHVSYTGVAGDLAVDFVAADAAGGFAAISMSATGPWTQLATTSFAYPEIGVMHQALLPFNLTTPGKAGFYKVGTATGESAVFPVFPTPARADNEIFAIYGDFGLENDECLSDLVSEAAKGAYDSVAWTGDWAYNFETALSITGNRFMQVVQGFAATKPVMPTDGNHEACGTCPGVASAGIEAGNFSQYKARMHAVTLNSNTGNNRYYSYNRGLTHFLVFTAESYVYSVNAGFNAQQVAFMKADLAAVDRSVTPWVVALVHKDWTMQANAFADFSPVLQAGGVDVLFCGHVHYYNRYIPYDPMTNDIDTEAVSADGSTYTNPKYMTTIVSGGAGNREDESHYVKDAISQTGVENYGYGYWQAINATVATWNWHTVVPNGGPKDYSDSLTIVQTGRGH